MRPSQLLAAVLSISTLSAAWPEAAEVRAVENVRALLYGRQDQSESPEPTITEPPRTSEARSSSGRRTSSEEESARETESASSSSDKDSEETSSSDGKNTPKITGTNKPTATKITGGSKNRTSFPDDVPAGGIQMITPGPFDGTQYYKVGDWVEFVWNYTSLSVTPTAIDVLATCSANQGTYTIAVNQTVEETGRVLWDTKAYVDGKKQPPFVNDMYTLIIYDAQSSITAMPKPGYLAAYRQHVFGMYEPRAPTPWPEFKCVGCNAALASYDTSVLRITLLTGSTMLASFLFFTYNFGLW